MQSAKLKEVARQIRRDIIIMSGRANASHSGSALSAVEILVALYFDVMRIDPRRPDWALRDRFLLSKGHAGAVLYATLAERGFFSKKKLDQFCLGANLTTHPTRFSAPGVEVATGSLGHGLPMGVGMALAARMDRKAWRTYVLLSDGECDEGSVWESILFAGFHKLDNLTVIIDYNKIQSFGRTADVLDLEPLKQKFEAFRWNVSEVDGHDFEEIRDALGKAKKTQGKPQCIIAHTVKGKGVSYMEDKLEWHYRSPTGELGEQALKELRD
ncbi:MAG: transketolase [Patescibacteria group bacterium]